MIYGREVDTQHQTSRKVHKRHKVFILEHFSYRSRDSGIEHTGNIDELNKLLEGGWQIARNEELTQLAGDNEKIVRILFVLQK